MCSSHHVHLLVSTPKAEAIGRMMKALGQRSGTLWEGRYKSCPRQAEASLLVCQRSIELNPVRAKVC